MLLIGAVTVGLSITESNGNYWMQILQLRCQKGVRGAGLMHTCLTSLMLL